MSRPLICNVCGEVILKDACGFDGQSHANMYLYNIDDGHNSEPQEYRMDLCGKCLEKFLGTELIITKGDRF